MLSYWSALEFSFLPHNALWHFIQCHFTDDENECSLLRKHLPKHNGKVLSSEVLAPSKDFEFALHEFIALLLCSSTFLKPKAWWGLPHWLGLFCVEHTYYQRVVLGNATGKCCVENLKYSCDLCWHWWDHSFSKRRLWVHLGKTFSHLMRYHFLVSVKAPSGPRQSWQAILKEHSFPWAMVSSVTY